MTQAQGLAFFISQLAYLEQKMYEVKYKNLNYKEIVPVSNEAGEWATSIDYFFMDPKGSAKFVGAKSLDIPIVEVGTDKRTVPVELAATGYEYSDEEIRQAIHLKRNLPAMKTKACMRAYQELAHETCLYGNENLNLPGLLNNPNVTITSVQDYGNGKSWADKTPLEIIQDVNDFLSGVFVDSLQVEKPNRLLLPTTRWAYISGTPRSDLQDKTILQSLVDNSPYLISTNDVKPMAELETAGEGGSTRMIAYDYDPEKLTCHEPMPLKFGQPQRKGRGYEVPGEFKLAGTEVRYPGSMAYGDDL